MFLKPFKVKSHSLVKKSDKRKLHDQLLRGNADISKDILEDLLPLKGDFGVTRLITHCHGEVLVYTNKKTPFFFTFQQALYPTVYALWKHPGFLATFTTHQFVFSRLQNGADLMLPGVMIPKSGLPNFNLNQPSSINISGNKAAVAVGVTEMSRKSVVEGGVRSGKLVVVLHCYEDHLWEFGEKTNLPNLPVEIFGDEDEEDEEVDNGDNQDTKNVLEKDVAPSKMVEELAKMASNKIEGVNCTEENEREKACDGVDNDPGYGRENDAGDEGEDEAKDIYQHESIPDSMDELLKTCFLYALKRFEKEMKMPLLTNLFYKNYMMPCCPKDHPLLVKRSSYKKLSAFLEGMRDERFIGVEGVAKGVESISFVDFEHDSLRSFELPVWQLCDVQKADDDDDNADDDWINYIPPQFTPVFLTTAPLLGILNFAEKKFVKGDVITGSEAREIVTAYVKANNLQQGRFVQLDMFLSQAILNKNDYTEVLQWNDLMEVFCKKMTPAHLVEFSGRSPIIQRGKIQQIKFDVKQKASNKKVTEVWSLGIYGIDVTKLASYIQRTVSCNAFVVHADDKSAKSAVLYVAGNHINFIQKLLNDKYRLSPKHMTGLEKAIKKKKGKK